MSSSPSLAFEFQATASGCGRFWTFVRNLPRLAEGSLASCDLVAGGEHAPSTCIARFGSRAVEGRIVERLTFWAAAQCGTLAPSLASGDERSATWEHVEASLVPFVADAIGYGSEGLSRDLFVDLEEWGAELVKLERSSTTLFVRSDIAPPLGDTLLLRYSATPRAGAQTAFVTASVTARMQRGLGSTVDGFTVEVVGDEAFTAWAAALPSRGGQSPWSPREQRIPLRALGELALDESSAPREVTIENVSRSGALVVGGPLLPTGSLVTLSFPVAGAWLTLRGSVARVGPDGTGVRFDCDPFANLRLSAQLERLTDPPRRALVVDDDCLARRMLADSMAEHGFEVTTASDGDAALGVLRDQVHCIDAVITDVCMPGLSGDELVRRLRGVAGEEYIPIIAITAGATPEVVRRIEAAGVDVVLAKSAGAQAIAEAASELARMRPPPSAPAS